MVRPADERLEIEAKAEIVVDYSRPLSAMVEGGQYHKVDSRITDESFPIEPGETKVKVAVAFLDGAIDSDEVLSAFAKHGLQPATLAELLAFGERRPREHARHPLVELGTTGIGDGEHYVVYRSGDENGWGKPEGSEWELRAAWVGFRWPAYYRFLAREAS